MDPKVTEIRRALAARSDRITSGVDELRKEVTTIVSPESIFGHPLVAAAGALAAGVVVGLIVSGLGHRGDSQSDLLRVVDTHLANVQADCDPAKKPPVGASVASQLASRLLPIAFDWGLSALARRSAGSKTAD